VSASSAERPPSFPELFDRIAANVAQVVRGKDELIRLTVMCLVAEGHLLVEDVPGVGKTSIAKALARSVDGTFGRIQFTPDLLPSDVVGTAVWNQREAGFELRRGPVFANLLLADEINRASPKTQAALLEAMAEEQVTLDGSTHRLPRPFMVIATQNPIEHQGTYPLPESQLDRFLMRVHVGYPSRDHELEVLASDGGDTALGALHPVVGTDHIVAMCEYVATVHVGAALAAYLLDIADATRTHRHLALGMAYEDTIRVAQLKIREGRIERLRRESGTGEDALIRVSEFMKPGPEEIFSMLPPKLATRVLAWIEKRGWS